MTREKVRREARPCFLFLFGVDLCVSWVVKQGKIRRYGYVFRSWFFVSQDEKRTSNPEALRVLHIQNLTLETQVTPRVFIFQVLMALAFYYTVTRSYSLKLLQNNTICMCVSSEEKY